MVGVKTMWILVYLLKEQGRQAQAQAQAQVLFFFSSEILVTKTTLSWIIKVAY